MRRKTFILLTLIISLFVFCGRVEAAKELTCVYPGGATEHLMIIQYSDGHIEVYRNGHKAEVQDPNWKKYENYNLNFDLAKTAYDSSSGYLNDCPQYSSGISATSSSNDVFFADKATRYKYKNKTIVITDKLANPNNTLGIPDFNNVYMDFDCNVDYSSQINSGNWIGKCIYSINGKNNFTLYFNENSMIVDNKLVGKCISRMYFSLNELLNVGYCPRIFQVSLNPNHSAPSSVGEYYLSKQTVLGPAEQVELTFIDGWVKVPTVPPSAPIDDCATLFGDNLINKINDIMDIVKIVIPILLIVYGIVDFTKAIFAGKEDDMKKSQKTFFNRILAALLVFLAPIFVNLILELANEVWSNIQPDSCIKVDNK